jgi:hypothetical protein
MKTSLLAFAFLVLGTGLWACHKDDPAPPPAAPVADKVNGTWQEASVVCNTVASVSTNITSTFSFASGSYTIVNKVGSCTATRTGTYTAGPNPAGPGEVLSLSFSSLVCSPSPCSGTYQLNSQTVKFECPAKVSNDGNNFLLSVDSANMFLTPTVGGDTNCYYKYSKQ